MGFFDFVKLEKNSLAVLTDSGTVQEECAIFGIPNITVRDVTERPETVDCGSNLLAGVTADSILAAVSVVTGRAPAWTPPVEYMRTNVAETVCRVVLGDRTPDLAEAEWRAKARL